MNIRFDKIYPDLSQIDDYVSLLGAKYRIYVALLLATLRPDSKIVYASPAIGEGLIDLAPLLSSHRVLLIENYCMRKSGDSIEDKQQRLKDSINRSRVDRIELIEDDFSTIWGTLSDVDFLLLDGPPTTTNFEPFADNFIYMMHDINQRLRDDFPGDSISSYCQYLCRADDKCQFAHISDAELHPVLKGYRDTDRTDQLWQDYGPHAWLIGNKITEKNERRPR